MNADIDYHGTSHHSIDSKRHFTNNSIAFSWMLCQARVRQPNFQINIFVQKHMFMVEVFLGDMRVFSYVAENFTKKRVLKTVAISSVDVVFLLFCAQN